MQFEGFDSQAYILNDEVIIEGREYPIGRYYEGSTQHYLALRKDAKVLLECKSNSNIRPIGFAAPELGPVLSLLGFKSPFSGKSYIFFIIDEEDFSNCVLKPFEPQRSIKLQSVKTTEFESSEVPESVSNLTLSILSLVKELQAKVEQIEVNQAKMIEIIEITSSNVKAQQMLLNRLFPQE